MLKLNYKIALVILLSLTAVTGIYSQKREFPVKGVDNLIVGMKSTNYGLRRTAILLAGEYKIKKTAPVLVTVFKNEEKSEIRILIALSLYRIGDVECINKLYEIAKNDNDPKVRTICNCIMEQYSEDSLIGLNL